MAAVVGGAIALAGGVVGLVGKAAFDRRTESRTARRAFYVDLLTLLAARGTYMQAATWDPAAKESDVPNDRIDRLNALLLVDATDQVKARATVCFRLLSRFSASRSMDAPIEVDEGGYYHYRFDQVRGVPDEARKMAMRMSLGKVADEYVTALDALAAQVKREVHGKV